MYRLCSVLLLFVTASIGSELDLEPLHVHLKPTKDIKVCEGYLVLMNCTWNLAEYGSMSDRVSWHFNNITEKDKCNSLKLSQGIPPFNYKTYNLSVLSKPSIRIDESGWYFCKVTRDIPFLTYKCSNGLHVLVEENPIRDNPELNSTSGPNQTSTQDQTTTVSTICSSSVETPKSSKVFLGQWWIWVAVAVGFSVIIVSVIAKCMLSYRTKEVIYENTDLRKTRCGRRDQMDGCNLPPSKKVETIKPLRKYDTLSQNRIRNQY